VAVAVLFRRGHWSDGHSRFRAVVIVFGSQAQNRAVGVAAAVGNGDADGLSIETFPAHSTVVILESLKGREHEILRQEFPDECSSMVESSTAALG